MTKAIRLKVNGLDGKPGRFWEARVDGRNVVIRFGTIGSGGKSTTIPCVSPEDANDRARRMAADQINKGFVPEGTSGPEDLAATGRKAVRPDDVVQRLRYLADSAPGLTALDAIASRAVAIDEEEGTFTIAFDGGQVLTASPPGDPEAYANWPTSFRTLVEHHAVVAYGDQDQRIARDVMLGDHGTFDPDAFEDVEPGALSPLVFEQSDWFVYGFGGDAPVLVRAFHEDGSLGDPEPDTPGTHFLTEVANVLTVQRPEPALVADAPDGSAVCQVIRSEPALANDRTSFISHVLPAADGSLVLVLDDRVLVAQPQAGMHGQLKVTAKVQAPQIRELRKHAVLLGRTLVMHNGTDYNIVELAPKLRFLRSCRQHEPMAPPPKNGAYVNACAPMPHGGQLLCFIANEALAIVPVGSPFHARTALDKPSASEVSDTYIKDACTAGSMVFFAGLARLLVFDASASPPAPLGNIAVELAAPRLLPLDGRGLAAVFETDPHGDDGGMRGAVFVADASAGALRLGEPLLPDQCAAAWSLHGTTLWMVTRDKAGKRFFVHRLVLDGTDLVIQRTWPIAFPIPKNSSLQVHAPLWLMPQGEELHVVCANGELRTFRLGAG